MKTVLLIAICSTLLICCNKNNNNNDDEGHTFFKGFVLTGRWLATESYYSPGAGLYWADLPTNEKFILDFKEDGSFTCSANFPKADSLFSSYRLSGSRILMSSSLNTKKDTWYYSFNQPDKLELSIILCIEGCGYGLRRIQ